MITLESLPTSQLVTKPKKESVNSVIRAPRGAGIQ